MARIVYVVTHPMSASYLLAGQLGWLRERGYEVAVAAAPGPELAAVARREGVEVWAVPMAREMAPLRDLVALVRLVRLFRRRRPEIVNASTPKAGLLGMVAARLAGVPVRIYTLRGLRLETARGARRALLRAAERAAGAAAHRVLCVSPSLRERCLELGLAPARKTAVLAAGSSNGVDLSRFPAGREREAERRRVRGELGIPEAAPVVGFVGRLTRDKGLADLVAAFDEVAAVLPEARLLLAGEPEAGDPLPEEVARRLASDPRILGTGFAPDAAPCYAAMDVLALPSYREGFPNAPLEAAAAGLPTAGYRVTGTVDAVADGATGTLVAPAARDALAEALLAYLRDPDLRRRHGRAARERAGRLFARERVWAALEGEYRRLLREAGRAGEGLSADQGRPLQSRGGGPVEAAELARPGRAGERRAGASPAPTESMAADPAPEPRPADAAPEPMTADAAPGPMPPDAAPEPTPPDAAPEPMPPDAAPGATPAGAASGPMPAAAEAAAPTFYRRRGKRLLDAALAAPALLLLSPLLALAALAVGLGMGRPVLFRQERPGLGGRPFTLYKLRTMREGREARETAGGSLADARRLTPLGRLLRAASLDELPELWNVLRGEMSLVGPRPLLSEYLPRYSPEQARRHEVRPGITGWAQVRGRNAATWEERLALDVWYADRLSLALDLRILALTLWKVLRREGIAAPGHATMPEFKGHRK